MKKYIKPTWLILISALTLAGCYTPKKAEQQTHRALDKYPGVSAGIIRERFPCVTTKTDSASYLNRIDQLKRMADSMSSLVGYSEARAKQIADSLTALIRTDSSGYDCEKEARQAYQYAGKIQSQLEAEKATSNKLRATINALVEDARKNPVTRYVEDKANTYILEAEKASLRDDLAKTKKLYDEDHAWRQKQEKKNRGKVVIRIPWWLIALLGVGLILKLKSKIPVISKLFAGFVLLITLPSCSEEVISQAPRFNGIVDADGWVLLIIGICVGWLLKAYGRRIVRWLRPTPRGIKIKK